VAGRWNIEDREKDVLQRSVCARLAREPNYCCVENIPVKPRCDSCGETFDNVDYVVILRKRQKSDVEQHQFCCLQCLRIWLRETAETPNEERQESFCFEHDEGAKHPFKILYTDCLGQKHECRFEKLGSLIKLRARLILPCI